MGAIWYLAVFLASFAVDLIPVIGPPAWTVMLFFQSKFDLNIWLVLVVGVIGSALGRFGLSLYIPKVSNRLIKRHKNEDLEFLGKKLGQKHWKSWLFVFIYTLMPIPTTPLFTAAGVARMNPLAIVPPFFVGKFISDGMMILIGKETVSGFNDLVQGTFSWKSIVMATVGILLLAALLFIDWRQLLEKKKFKLTFNIWK